MSDDALSMLAEGAAVEVHLSGVWLVTAGALALALLARRRLPVGVGDALFVTGLSVALGAAYLPGDDSVAWPLRLSALLTGLAVLWHFGVRWVERDSEPTGSNDADKTPATPPDDALSAPRAQAARQLIGGHAVVLCGLATAGVALALPGESSARLRLGVTTCLVILLALALRRYLDEERPLSRYAALGLLGCAVYPWIPADRVPLDSNLLSVGLLVAAAAGLLGALLPVWQHWQHRRRAWRTDPERLTEPPAEHPLLLNGVLVVCMLVGLGGLLAADRLLMPLAVGLAAIAACTAAHRRQRGVAGEIGLALVGESVILAAVAWLPTSGVNALLGCALASVYLLWLARFWHQQLHNGAAWTTAGQLIPPARRLAYCAALACGGLAVSAACSTDMARAGVAWPAGIAVLLLVLLAFMLVRDAMKEDSPAAAFAACVVTLAAIVPVQRILRTVHGGLEEQVPWSLLGAILAVVLALRVGVQAGDRDSEVAYNAYFGGIIPVAALCVLAGTGAYSGEWSFALLAAGCVLLAIGLRWRRRSARRGVSDPQVPGAG